MPAPRTRHRPGLLVLGGWLVVAIGGGESHAADPGVVVVDSATTSQPPSTSRPGR